MEYFGFLSRRDYPIESRSDKLSRRDVLERYSTILEPKALYSDCIINHTYV